AVPLRRVTAHRSDPRKAAPTTKTTANLSRASVVPIPVMTAGHLAMAGTAGQSGMSALLTLPVSKLRSSTTSRWKLSQLPRMPAKASSSRT
ncbi:MAG: hypothetical protein NWP95_01035, partial [Pontimonas sp.]|nr:hypothetical protein [Pontimonas sp.]